MLWLKAFHIVSMVAWFAGLFYLPRLFIYHLQAATPAEHERFCVMERKLMGIMTIGMVLTWVLGVLMVTMVPAYLRMPWLHAKLVLVLALSGYHGWLKVNVRRFAGGANRHSDRFWRIANEVPAIALIAIVILVVVKPF